jgi:hypothetical protein
MEPSRLLYCDYFGHGIFPSARDNQFPENIANAPYFETSPFNQQVPPNESAYQLFTEVDSGPLPSIRIHDVRTGHFLNLRCTPVQGHSLPDMSHSAI